MKWWKNFIKCGIQLRIQLAARREFMYKHYSVLLLRKNISTGKRVTRQETTFTRTIWISENQRLQTKTPEKLRQYGQPGWVWNVLRNLCHDFHLHCQVHWLTPLLRCCLKALLGQKTFSRGILTGTAMILALFLLRNLTIFICWWHYRFRHRAS